MWTVMYAEGSITFLCEHKAIRCMSFLREYGFTPTMEKGATYSKDTYQGEPMIITDDGAWDEDATQIIAA